MEKNRKEWVCSATGKPVHLVDITYRLESGDYQRICINRDMAEKRIPIEVFNTMFVQGYYSDPIRILDLCHEKAEAKKKHDEYFKIVEAEQKKVEEEKKDEDKTMEEAIRAAKDAFDKKVTERRKSKEARPKVIRKKIEDEI